MKKMYELMYLPAAKQDLVDIAQYIHNELHNASAAIQLVSQLIDAGEKLTDFPYANPVYIPLRPLLHEYRKLFVKNYLMLYWVDEKSKTVTIARVLYAKREYTQLLEN